MYKTKIINGRTIIEFDKKTEEDMQKIITLCKHIFSAPCDDSQCRTLLETLIDIQFTYSDDLYNLEELLLAAIDYLQLLEYRLGRFAYSDF